MTWRHATGAVASQIRRMLAIATTTSIELQGQPAVLLVTLSGFVATALIPLLQLHSFGEPGRLARDGGLAYQMVIGIVLAAIGAATTLHDEIDSGAVSSAISKPVSRDVFLLGKWLGVMRVVLRFWFCALSAILVAERIAERMTPDGPATDKPAQLALLLAPALALICAGYRHNRKGRRFCKGALDALAALSAALLALAFVFDRTGAASPSLANLDLRIVPVSVLVLMSLAVNAAIALALATRLGAAPSIAICLALLFLGLASDAIRLLPFGFLSVILPDVQSFWMCDSLADGASLPVGYLGAAAIYSLSLVAVALGVGMLSLRRREIA